ncbi:hypothetical protein VB715_20985 [Crocosphaera sp. UHCC 0190]|uniref:hypothetical protein n=1 Tax=Crocosphaera sp. UHCC 0190 TaxID=3110246 RepID=UPI002B21C4C4|nr:hypothetical protein [Crocosphaera sp. UHCC 0190]MEA5512250.1 hypothetical protein [Crocosphaera sp. UHCC 0190]
MSFQALLEKLTIEKQNRESKCHLLAESYASIDAIETFNHTTKKRQVHWICEKRSNGYVFLLLDGVTGHESWYLNDLVEIVSRETDCKFFTACLGCDSYPELKLDLTQMKWVVMQLYSQFN